MNLLEILATGRYNVTEVKYQCCKIARKHKCQKDQIMIYYYGNDI